MRFNAALLIICLTLQSCSTAFIDWGKARSPSSVADFDDFTSKMKNFKGRVMGSDQDGKCTQEQMDKYFEKLVASVKIDSCSVDKYKIDRDESNQKACPRVKTEGYFDKVVKQTLKDEKSKKPLTFFQQKRDPEFEFFNKEAQGYLRVLKTYIDDENFSHEDRANLVAAYVENVVLPIRDLVIIMRSYLPKEDDGNLLYTNLQPVMTQAFTKGLGTEEVNLLTQGPNPSASPFYMEIKPAGNGSYRLSFSETDVIRRDVLTLLKAPTAKNYVIALKWMTLHMMLSQVFLYDTLLGNKEDFPIPNSCQNHFNGNMPSKLSFTFEEGTGEQFLENILASHGLTYKEDDSSYLDYYINNVNSDPTKEAYSGLVPFENYKNALRSAEGSGPAALEPQFDDVAHFHTVLNFKSAEAQSVFRGKVKGQNVTYTGFETFQKMLGEIPVDEISDIKLKDGKVEQIYSGKQNLSPYLLEVMQANGITDYSDLITEKLANKFKGKTVTIDFPSLYSSPIWRDWSLRLLADKIYSLSDAPKNSGVYQAVLNACIMNTRKNVDLAKICNGNVMTNLSDFLIEFRTGEKYIPTRRLEETRYKELYPFLGFIWTNLRDNLNLLPEAKPFELNFLTEQMSAGNPWARLKLSYMVALDQLEYQEEGILPQYNQKKNFSRENDEVMCKINNVTLEYNTISRAGKILGLDRPLSYNHAGKFLSSKEKSQVWKNIVDDIQQKNAQLFSVKNRNQTYYQTTENISYKTILTEQAALSTGVNLSQKATNEIKQVGQKTEAKLADFFLKLYSLRDPAKQQELFEKFSEVNGIDTAFSAKMNFLAMDDAFKKPIYKDLLKQAAQTRKLQIISQLDKFCKMSVNDEKQFKDIFYQTTKAQNELNQMAGLPSVPQSVMSKVGEMSSSEWRDMWLGLGGMAAILVGGACTTMTGGICAPIGGVVAVAGLGALGIQVKLTTNELDRKVEADASEKQVKVMEDLGFANIGSSDEAHRSYAWTAFEAISIFPLLGLATRSLTTGTKLAYVSSKALMRKTGKESFKALTKSFNVQEEVRSAYYLLDMTNVSKNAGLDAKTVQNAKTKIEKIRKLYTSGEISSEVMMGKIAEVINPIKRAKLALAKTAKYEVGKITVKESKDQIDKQASTMIANYFADNPKEMLRVIQSYSGERLDRAVRVMGEVNATDRIGKIPVFSGAKDWFLRMRNEDLAKNASKILRIERELKAMADAGNKAGQLQAYINRNIEDLTDIFIDIPFKKREIPYFIFVQGMPEFNFYKGRKIPLFSLMSEGQTLRRLFTARARLVHETYKSQARNTFKLKRYVQSETTYEVFNSFKLSVADLANKKTGAEAKKVLTEYRIFEEAVTKKLHTKFTANGQKMDYKKFKELITNPANAKDQATAEAIWSSIPADELMGMKEVSTYAHKAVQELSKYSDIDSFERYLNALKVLTINRNAAVLEIM